MPTRHLKYNPSTSPKTLSLAIGLGPLPLPAGSPLNLAMNWSTPYPTPPFPPLAPRTGSYYVTGEFPVTEFGLREKKKMELNKERFTGKLRKHRN